MAPTDEQVLGNPSPGNPSSYQPSLFESRGQPSQAKGRGKGHPGSVESRSTESRSIESGSIESGSAGSSKKKEPARKAPEKGKSSESGRSLSDPPITVEEIQEKGAEGKTALKEIATELCMRWIEGRRMPPSKEKRKEGRKAAESVGLTWRTIQRRAAREYEPPKELSQVEEGPFQEIRVSLALSRKEWPPEPRRGDSYSETQMREEVASGAFGLPLSVAMDRFGASRLKGLLREQGAPDDLFKSPSMWQPGQTYRSRCQWIGRPLAPEKYSARSVAPTPEAVQDIAEEKVFGPVESEIRLWEWLVENAEVLAGEMPPEQAFVKLKEIKRIGRTATSKGDLIPKVLFYSYGVTLGKTKFHESRQKPPFAGRAEFEEEIPTVLDLWREEKDMRFEEALRLRREYERSIEEARRRAREGQNLRFKKGVTEVVYPFFSDYTEEGWSTTHLGTLSKKWDDYFEDWDISPKLHRDDTSGQIVIEGEKVGHRHYGPKQKEISGGEEKGEDVKALFYYVAHLRRRIALTDQMEPMDNFKMTKKAKKDAAQELKKGRDPDDLYEGVEELIVDKQIGRA
jgi:hypothetical protein